MRIIKSSDYELIMNIKKNGLNGAYDYFKKYLNIDYPLDSQTLYYHLTESAFRILDIKQIKYMIECGVEKQIRAKMYKKQDPSLTYFDLSNIIINRLNTLVLQTIDDNTNKVINLYQIDYQNHILSFEEYEEAKAKNTNKGIEKVIVF